PSQAKKQDQPAEAGGGGEKTGRPVSAATGTTAAGAGPPPEGDQGAQPGTNASPGAETGTTAGPIVEVTSIEQVEELKKRGMIPAGDADRIEDKLRKQDRLSFEEAASLLDALNKFITPDDTAKPASGSKKPTWVEWAKFIRENQEKLSGQVRVGEK